MNSHQKRILRRLLDRKHANGYAAGVAAERARVRGLLKAANGAFSVDEIVPEPTP